MSKKLFKKLIKQASQPLPKEQNKHGARLFRVVLVTILLLILGLMIDNRLPPKTTEYVAQPLTVQQV
jgi:hypothetical protein